MSTDNALDRLMERAEEELGRRLTEYPDKLFGKGQPFQRKLTPKQMQRTVWDVVGNRRPASDEEWSLAYDILRKGLVDTARQARERRNAG